jgi:YidC/Oxa1 family membrane protein insertase
MMPFFIHFIYLPIYNVLAFLVDLMPAADLGLAIIAVTLAVKLVFLPLSLSAAKTQKTMKAIQPHLDALKEKHKENPQEHAKATFALYKEHKVKPFSSMLMMLIQIPILIGLYAVARDVAHYGLDPKLLYSFVEAPEHVSVLFLGLFTISGSSLILALIAGLTQFAYAWIAVAVPPKKTSADASMQEEFGRAMSIQMRFIFPLVMTFIAYASGVIALYFAASNLFMLAQEFVVRAIHKTPNLPPPAVSSASASVS